MFCMAEYDIPDHRYNGMACNPRQTTKMHIWVRITVSLGQLYERPPQGFNNVKSIWVIYQRKHYYYVFCFTFQCLPFEKRIAIQTDVNHILYECIHNLYFYYTEYIMCFRYCLLAKPLLLGLNIEYIERSLHLIAILCIYVSKNSNDFIYTQILYNSYEVN